VDGRFANPSKISEKMSIVKSGWTIAPVKKRSSSRYAQTPLKFLFVMGGAGHG
jgi:hypothetical protein